VSTGSWWFGHAVSPGRVLYVVAEGATGVPQRVDAWQHARQTWSIGDIMWLPAPVDIFQAERAGDVTRLLRDQNSHRSSSSSTLSPGPYRPPTRTVPEI
jgi:hypothetical protein